MDLGQSGFALHMGLEFCNEGNFKCNVGLPLELQPPHLG